MTKWCYGGQHMAPLTSFRQVNGKPFRDCQTCEARKREPWSSPVNSIPVERPKVRRKYPDFSGVDIDAIHYKLGAVRKKVAA